MSIRRLRGLAWAKALPGKPEFIPNSRPKGTKAQGLRYERLCAKAIPQARHGIWFQYQDQNGLGWCQVDLLLSLAGRIFVLECKLTDTPEAYEKLQALYLPIVGLALQRPTCGLVVAKNLTPQSKFICSTLDGALAHSASGALPLLHWLGRSPLVTPLAGASSRGKKELDPATVAL